MERPRHAGESCKVERLQRGSRLAYTSDEHVLKIIPRELEFGVSIQRPPHHGRRNETTLSVKARAWLWIVVDRRYVDEHNILDQSSFYREHFQETVEGMVCVSGGGGGDGGGGGGSGFSGGFSGGFSFGGSGSGGGQSGSSQPDYWCVYKSKRPWSAGSLIKLPSLMPGMTEEGKGIREPILVVTKVNEEGGGGRGGGGGGDNSDFQSNVSGEEVSAIAARERAREREVVESREREEEARRRERRRREREAAKVEERAVAEGA